MGFVQSRKPLKLIHQFSFSIKNQQKPVRHKLMLALCQALGGYISFKFEYNKPGLKYQQRTRQSEWKEIGEVAASFLMEIQMTVNKSRQLLWIKSGTHFLFSLDVLCSVKDNSAFLSYFYRPLCHWSSETAEMEGQDTFLRTVLSMPVLFQVESTCAQESQGIFAFQGSLCAQGNLETNM